MYLAASHLCAAMLWIERPHQWIVPWRFLSKKRKNPPFDNTTAKQVSKDGFNRHKDGILKTSRRIDPAVRLGSHNHMIRKCNVWWNQPLRLRSSRLSAFLSDQHTILHCPLRVNRPKQLRSVSKPKWNQPLCAWCFSALPYPCPNFDYFFWVTKIFEFGWYSRITKVRSVVLVTARSNMHRNYRII